MENQGTWWEYPVSSPSGPEYDNASRAMGLGRYNYYIQIRPLDESKYNVTAANDRATEMVGNKGDVASVVRYSRMNQLDLGDFDGAYLYGHMKPTKPLFGLENEHFDYINEHDGLEFNITNWTITAASPEIQDISIGIGINSQFSINPTYNLKPDEFDIYKNNNLTSLKVAVLNETDNIRINIPISSINKIDNWDDAEFFFIQLNVKNLNVTGQGITLFSSTSRIEEFSLKTTIWVW